MAYPLTQVLPVGKGGTTRDRPKKARVLNYEPTNANGIQG